MIVRRPTAILGLALIGACVAVLVPMFSRAQGAVFLGPGQSLDQTIKMGQYLAHVGDCIACHTKHDGAPFAGGFALPTPFGTLYSPNITPDPQTGIGN